MKEFLTPKRVKAIKSWATAVAAVAVFTGVQLVTENLQVKETLSNSLILVSILKYRKLTLQSSTDQEPLKKATS